MNDQAIRFRFGIFVLAAMQQASLVHGVDLQFFGDHTTVRLSILASAL